MFLERVAWETSNRMPDKDEFHIPYFEKRQVYRPFKNHWSVRNAQGNSVSIPTFS